MSSLTYLDKQRKVAYLSRSGAIVTAGSYAPDYSNTVKSSSATVLPYYSYSGNLADVARWGENNLKPSYLLELLSGSNINSQLIYRSVSFALGKLYTFKWQPDESGQYLRRIPFNDPRLDDYLRRYEVRQLMRQRATDFIIFGNTFAKINLSLDRQSFVSAEHIDAFSSRLHKNRQRVFVHPNWDSPKEDDLVEYPIFSRMEPDANLSAILHSKLYWPGHPFYGVQPWHAGHNWITFANSIPVWMSANINKSYNVKYHIQYPDNYFDYLEKMDLTPEQREIEKDRFFDNFDKMLAGAENAQTTIYTPYSLDPVTGKPNGSWTITPVPNDLKDDAFVRAFETSNSAMTSAHGIDPSLAGIESSGKMPASGSEKRIAYQIHEVLATQEVREIMVEPLEIMRDMNGFDPDIQFGFLKANIVTLAEDKSGLSNPMAE
jgi:hypothetical protein